MLPEPTLRHVANFNIDLDPISEMGNGHAGKRRIIPIVGGRITGPETTGKILNVVADWQKTFSSGVAELDTLYALLTHDDAVIEIINFGDRHGSEDAMQQVAAGDDFDPSNHYMREHARLETDHPKYDCVNGTLFLEVGERLKSRVRLSIFTTQYMKFYYYIFSKDS